jgi:hypothetical protein
MRRRWLGGGGKGCGRMRMRSIIMKVRSVGCGKELCDDGVRLIRIVGARRT